MTRANLLLAVALLMTLVSLAAGIPTAMGFFFSKAAFNPVSTIVPGLYDLFVFDAHEPAKAMRDFAVITGPAALPPRWALGYMQSHRTL